MNKREWNEVMNAVSIDLVEEYVDKREKLAKKKETRQKITRLTLGAAACFVLIFGLFVLLPIFTKDKWADAKYSAEDIAKLYDFQTNGVGTKSYSEINVTYKDYLYIKDIPDQKTLPLYRYYGGGQTKVDEDEFRSYLNSVIPALASAFGGSVPEYKIKRYASDSFGEHIDAYTEIKQGSSVRRMPLRIGNCSVLLSQTERDNGFSITSETIVLDGEPIQLDLTLTDEQLIQYTENWRKKLCDVLGMTLPDMAVKRDPTRIYIVLYNKNALPLNSLWSPADYMGWMPSDSVRVVFDDYHGTYLLDKSVITCAQVYVNKGRSKIFEHIGDADMISLEEAEELLCKGYVFGGHSCAICMNNHSEVDFEDYDYVGFEYVRDCGDLDEPNLLIPFYVFYKKTGTRGDMVCYAKTYVCAIELSGYDEYFENCESFHDIKDTPYDYYR